jgi:uncharacterized phage-associated protein
MAAEPSRLPIRFTLDERKAADAASFLIHRHGGVMNHMLLVKLLYAAERESLKRFNRPIVGDRYVSMKHGPVVSGLLNLINEERTFPAWAVLIERSSPTEVRLLTDEPPLRSLSDADIEALTAAIEQYPDMDQFEVRDAMHREFAEWENPGNSSWPIPVERILRVLNKSEDDVERVRRVQGEKRYFQKLFGG